MLKQFILSKVMPMPVFTEADYKAAERELAGKEKNKPAQKSSVRNPNVRSLHYIDEEDEDYGSPAAVKGKAWEEPQEETAPAVEEPKEVGGAYGEGVTMKEDRPEEKRKEKKKDKKASKKEDEGASDH